MECRDARPLMVDHLYGEVDADQGWRLEGNVATCAGCRAEWEQLRADVAALDRWTAPAPPPGLVEGVLADLARKRAERAERGLSLLRVERAIGGILLGAVAAALSLLLVAGAAGVRVSPLGFGLLAALWATLYGAAFVLAQSSAFRGLGRVALVAAGVVVASAPLLSIPAVVEACERLAKALQGGAPLALVIAVAAVGYTAAPLLIAGLLGRAEPAGRRAIEGLKLSVLYGLLIAPAVYLQCVGLPLEVTAVWMAGALVGAVVGGPVGLRLSGWARQPV